MSLCTCEPLSRIKERTELSPPASKTAPASRVHTNSKTWLQAITRVRDGKKDEEKIKLAEENLSV